MDTLFLSRKALFLLLATALCLGPAQAADGWLAQAQTLEKARDRTGLLRLGQAWSQAEPANPLAWFVQGRAYTLLDQPILALAAYQRNLALDPRDSYAANNVGNLHILLGQPRDALLAYRQAVRADPAYLLAWRNLGQSYYLLRGPAGVRQALLKLHETDPVLAQSWGALAATYALRTNRQVEQQALRILAGLSADQRERMFAILLADLP
jgi:tetratricopeptide (TPR) repeat protein